MILITFPAWAEENSLYEKAIVSHQQGDVLAARHYLEQILRDPPDNIEVATIEAEWGNLMYGIIVSDINTAETISYSVKPGDTLGKIAQVHGTTIELIKKRNKLKDDRIIDKQLLSLWVAPFRLDVDKSDNILKVYLNDKVIKNYPVSTGKSETVTPVGNFIIKYRYPNPTWFHHGEIVPASSPKNFLGTRWLGFNKEKYGIHGTIYPELIGQSVSGGCVRMKNQDVEELYDLIPVGTKVTIH